ncbi:MAG TPA: SGNH/GDSL hydrolase family protein [Vicinamibacteria bacterium]|nr:SGNH/GDSL hydrolase family protein [Vicinamibacteria bacterium]
MASPAQPERAASVFARHPRVTLAALVLGLLVATDFAFTAGYQRLSRRLPRGEPRLRVRSEVFHHTFAPRVSLTAERWGPRACPYRTNSLGFRDAVVREVPLVGSGRRILFMGDSFTEGVGVPWEQTFVGLTAAALRPQGAEVLNGAVSLYSPTIYERKTRWLLEDVGLRFDELVVFIDISDILDETAYRLDSDDHVVLTGLVRRRAEQAAERWGRGRASGTLQAVGRFLDGHTLLLARGWDAVAGRLEPLHYGAGWTFDASLMAEYGQAGLARARERMDALAALLAGRGIRLTVAVYPWPDQVLMRDRASLQARVWREWASAHGAAFLDYFPVFITDEPPQETVRRYFIPGDVHWNEAGHRLVAGPLIARLSASASPPARP